MVKFYFRIPSDRGKREFFFILLACILTAFLGIIDDLTRDEADFAYQDQYCGKLIYYRPVSDKFQEPPGLKIKMESPFSLKTFDVNYNYIKSKIVKDQMKQGVSVCVYVIDGIFLVRDRFISQINISGADLLSGEDVIKEYLKPIISFRLWFLLVSLVMVLFLCLRVKKEVLNGNK